MLPDVVFLANKGYQNSGDRESKREADGQTNKLATPLKRMLPPQNCIWSRYIPDQ